MSKPIKQNSDNNNIFFDKNELKFCGKNVTIGKTVRIRNPSLVEIGDNVIIDDFTYISGSVQIGDYSHVAPGVVLSASSSNIRLKPFSGLAAGVKVYAGSSNYLDCGLDLPTIPKMHQYNVKLEEVEIGAFSLLGPGSIVLPGTTIPNGLSCLPNITIREKLKLKEWYLLVNEDGKLLPRRNVNKLLKMVQNFYSLDL